MVQIFGKNYYIDIDAINDACKVTNPTYDENGNEVTEINIFKYEVIKLCLERILNEFDDADEEMGAYAQKETSISFRLSFNTLEHKDILKTIEYE